MTAIRQSDKAEKKCGSVDVGKLSRHVVGDDVDGALDPVILVHVFFVVLLRNPFVQLLIGFDTKIKFLLGTTLSSLKNILPQTATEDDVDLSISTDATTFLFRFVALTDGSHGSG
jgi:hypothetical protein